MLAPITRKSFGHLINVRKPVFFQVRPFTHGAPVLLSASIKNANSKHKERKKTGKIDQDKVAGDLREILESLKQKESKEQKQNLLTTVGRADSAGAEGRAIREHRTDERDAAALRRVESSHLPSASLASEGNIPRPHWKTPKVSTIRQHIGLVEKEHDTQWYLYRGIIRAALTFALSGLNLTSKNQTSRSFPRVLRAIERGSLDPEISKSSPELLKVVRAVEEVLPDLKIFKNSWATKYLLSETYTNRRKYEGCKDDPTSYIGRKNLERQANRRRPPSRRSGR
ncbi:hypothetical protein L218DRAFT_964217 [Marasmius fiardii PR-910]|nr:hypothetical protein L218DRAFT_964217 [Marasmius fiardii PR-910]